MSSILVGGGPNGLVALDGAMANRHGLIAGATGTGKTITLQVLAEGFSRLGVPVFSADVKGDLSGVGAPGRPHPKVDERISTIGITDYRAEACPLRLWDIHGQRGHPVRATVADLGSALLGNLLELNENQEGLLHIAFDYAEREKLALLDLQDLDSLLGWIRDHRGKLSTEYGNISVQSIGAIQRRLLVLRREGGDRFFGEPMLDIRDLMQQENGRGVVNLLDGRDLMLQPRVYTTFLLWLLTELFEQLPECGDAPLPLLVFFFDEAHLLFANAPKPLLERIEQTVRLIRSKGVGIYFVTQSPADIPDNVLGQLGNRIQHALRAYTPKDQKAVRTAAASFRPNPELDTAQVITELGLGEALVSVLDAKGTPTVVERTLVAPPRSQIGPLDVASLNALRQNSPLAARYEQIINRDSAHERLQQRRSQAAERNDEAPLKTKPRTQRSNRQGFGEAFAKSLLRGLASQLSRALMQLLRQFLRGR